jgi:hypothetical protein
MVNTRIPSRKLSAKLATFSFIAAALVLTLQPVVSALTPQQRRDYAQQSIYFIDDPCPSPQATASVVTNEAYQNANARIVIGAAKSYGLGKKGAYIGLLTAVTESNLTNLGNTGIPESDNPLAQGIPSNDHASVGIMQQQVNQGWSTFGNYDIADAQTKKDITEQLMTVAYAAQAFYGTPPGAQLPSGLANPGALIKGLQNLPGGWDVWQNKDPAQAAQAVQNSAYPDRYNDPKNKDQAQSLLTQLWDTSSPIDLLIHFTGGASASTSETSCGFLGPLNDLKDAIVAFAWPEYRNPRGGIENARYATTRKPEYVIAVNNANSTGGYTGWRNSGIDCGAFVTRAMIDSGTDTGYNPRHGNTSGQIIYLRQEAAKPDGKYIRITKGSGTEGLLFGDIAIRSRGDSGHTFIFTGHFDYIDPVTKQAAQWSQDAASASGGRDGPLSGSDRAPMAGHDADNADDYEWYRLRSSRERGEFPV